MHLNREHKKMSHKRSDLYGKTTNTTKINYQKSKKGIITRRKAAHHTRMLEKMLAACTTNTSSNTLGLYDGFLGSQRDYIELEESECTDEPFLPNLNWKEEDRDEPPRPSLSDPKGRMDAFAREVKLDYVIANLMDRFN